MNLTAVRRFEIPRATAQESIQLLQAAARGGDELFVAWSGVRRSEDVFTFRSVHVPDQQCHHTEDGMLVTIPGEALFALSRSARERGEVVAGQIHAHPNRAFHSPADDQLSLVRLLGGISVVVPDFARQGLDGSRRWAVFYRDSDGTWSPRPQRVEVVLR